MRLLQDTQFFGILVGDIKKEKGESEQGQHQYFLVEDSFHIKVKSGGKIPNKPEILYKIHWFSTIVDILTRIQVINQIQNFFPSLFGDGGGQKPGGQ